MIPPFYAKRFIAFLDPPPLCSAPFNTFTQNLLQRSKALQNHPLTPQTIPPHSGLLPRKRIPLRLPAGIPQGLRCGPINPSDGWGNFWAPWLWLGWYGNHSSADWRRTFCRSIGSSLNFFKSDTRRGAVIDPFQPHITICV